MMRPSNELPVVYLCRDIIDFRKGINGLAVLVEEALQHDPFSERLFVFCNRKRDRIKSCTGNATASACGRSVWNGRGSSGPARWKAMSSH